jgi:hypothetical protein
MNRADLNAMIEAAKLNPMAVQRAGIEYLEAVHNGQVEIVDPSNAFVYLMEMGSTMFSNLARKDEFLNRVQYPELAMTRDELYRHMSDVDYINVFSSPSTAPLLLIYSLSEVMEKAVETGVAGVRKLTIPRHTKIMAGDVPFTLQYPIEIRVLPHGGLQIVYDNSRPSPLQPLESNNVSWYIVNYNVGHEEYIQLEVPTQQVELKSYTAPMSASKVFNKTYSYSDKFYYCRVYASDGKGGWDEIKTTHSDQVFDPNTPTAVLKLLDDNRLNVSIPQVYYSTGLINRTLRIDVYTTRGALELALQGYSPDMFKATYIDHDNDDNGKYTGPVSRLVTGYFMSGGPATGGSSAITFEKLKKISSGIGANVITLSKTINQLLADADVMNNGQRITMLPTNLYRDEGGYLSVLDKQARQDLMDLPADVLVERVTNGNYFYTPFHYVYDVSNDVFTVRPYYFGSPALTRRFFVMDNGTMGIGVNSNNHHFQRTDTGWVLQVMTNSTEMWTRTTTST